MPNWCECNLEVKSDNPNNLNNFRINNMIDNNIPLSFNKAVTRPVEMEDWYNWNIGNWGTKWDINDDETLLEININSLSYQFNTAWNPPLTWLETTAELYQDLEFIITFWEYGMNFAGKFVFSNGILVEKEETDCAEFHFKYTIDHQDLVKSNIDLISNELNITNQNIEQIVLERYKILFKLEILPQELIDMILDYIKYDIKKEEYTKLINNNYEDIKEFNEEEWGLYNEDTIKEKVIPLIVEKLSK